MISTLLLHVAFAAGFPAYTEAGIVNAANNRPGPLAPNTIATIYGTELSFITAEVTQTPGSILPNVLGGTRVSIGNIAAHLYFVSPGQINFLVPSSLRPGQHSLVVSSESRQGPLLRITVTEFTPAPFVLDNERVAATRQDGTVLTPEITAGSGDVVVIYATGLGATNPQFSPGTIPRIIAPIVRKPMRVRIGGVDVAPESIFYAGLTPGFAGLYQINVRVPELTEPDPEILLGDPEDGVRGPRLPYRPASLQQLK